MQIDTQISRVKIDQTQCFAESGLRTSLEIARVFYQNSVRMGIEAISTIVAEGRQMLDARRGSTAIQNISFARSASPQKQLVTTSMPQSRPKIDWDPGYVNINWEMGGVDIRWNVGRMEAEYEPASMNIFLRQKPSIEITVEDGIVLDFPLPRTGVGDSVDVVR